MYKCKNCLNTLDQIIDYGLMPISNAFKPNQKIKSYKFHMELMYCNYCKLVQLLKQPKPELMFNDSYPFFTGISQFMTQHFKDVAIEIINNYIKDEENCTVVEIGCNDGTFLNNFKNKKFKTFGFEPSKSAAKKAEEKGLTIISDFFNSKSSLILRDCNQANVIYASNVICHIADINNLASTVADSLVKNGFFIFEEPYLGDIIKLNSFDQIYDEHVFLFSLKSVENIFAKVGLKLFHAKHLNTHGGSMRYYLTNNQDQSTTEKYILLKEKEEKFRINDLQILKNFANNCEKFKYEFSNFINNLKSQKTRGLIGYPATSKSTTILNYVGANSFDFQAIYDSTRDKIGGIAPGSNIPVLDEKLITTITPDYCFLFGWNHHRELLLKLGDYSISHETKWITHIPQFTVYDNLFELSRNLDALINEQ